MEVVDPIEKLKQLKQIPDVVILHRAIDVENAIEGSDDAQKQKWQFVPKIKELYADKKLASGKDRVLVAVAGGIEPSTAEYALKMKADILIVGGILLPARILRTLCVNSSTSCRDTLI